MRCGYASPMKIEPFDTNLLKGALWYITKVNPDNLTEQDRDLCLRISHEVGTLALMFDVEHGNFQRLEEDNDLRERYGDFAAASGN